MLKLSCEVINLKRKIYSVVLFSHIGVLLTLLFPVIRVDEIRMGIENTTETESSYLNFFEFASNPTHILSAFLMTVFIAVHIVGIVNAIYCIITNKANRLLINLTFAYSFASALMGALQLYSMSYVLFTVCAVSFLLIALSSLYLMRKEY